MELNYLKHLTVGVDRDSVLHDLMNEYGNDVWNFAFYLIRRSDAADDICQEVFIAVYEKLHTFRGESSIKSWLLAITRNKTYKYRRNSFFSKVVLVDHVPRDETVRSAETEAFDRLETRHIWSNVMKLSLRFREVLLLDAHYQLTVQEIAAILDIAEGTVKSRLHRARKKLSILLLSDSEGGIHL